MGLELLVGPEGAETEAYGLGPATQVAAFAEWVDSLPAGRYPLLVAFVQDGRTERPDDLTDDLADAYEAFPPAPLAAHIANELGETCRDLPDGTLVRIQ